MWRSTSNRRGARDPIGLAVPLPALALAVLAALLLPSPARAVEPVIGPRDEAGMERVQPVGMQNLRFFLSMRQLEKQRTDAQALFTHFQQGGLIDPAISLDDVKTGTDTQLKPIASGNLSPELHATLDPAFSLALDRLRTVEECRSLFRQLRADGPVMLATTIYVPDPAWSGRACQRKGVAAFTTLGNPTTYLCESFASLPPRFAALSLIHEALHYAGLPERPVHPTAMSTWEINEVIHNRCKL